MSERPRQSAPEVFAAVVARIESLGLHPNEYNVFGLLDAIIEDGVRVTDVNNQDFLRLVTQNRLDNGTQLPCPPWCGRPLGHPFESSSALTGRQSRPHSRILAAGEGVHVALVQEDEREPGDDGTATQTLPLVSVEIEGDHEDAAELRKLAAELLNAADELDAVTGGGTRWTEDRL